MEEIVQIIQNLGFPIACVVALAVFLYKLVTRDKDEAANREQRLIEANEKISESLQKVADTIEESNRVNSELSETNKLLVDKIEGKLDQIDTNLTQVLERLNS